MSHLSYTPLDGAYKTLFPVWDNLFLLFDCEKIVKIAVMLK